MCFLVMVAATASPAPRILVSFSTRALAADFSVANTGAVTGSACTVPTTVSVCRPPT